MVIGNSRVRGGSMRKGAIYGQKMTRPYFNFRLFKNISAPDWNIAKSSGLVLRPDGYDEQHVILLYPYIAQFVSRFSRVNPVGFLNSGQPVDGDRSIGIQYPFLEREFFPPDEALLGR